MFPDESARGLAHFREIERLRDMPRLHAEERIHRSVVVDEVAILFSAGIEARVEIGRSPNGAHDANVPGQMRVEREGEFAGLHVELRAREIHMGDQSARVDAGVGSAGTMEAKVDREDVFERLFDEFLDGHAGFLHLPAGVIGPVVGDGEFETNRLAHVIRESR